MSKILFLNRLFGPDTEATGSLLTELTQDLAGRHDITVICGPADNSPTGSWPMIRRESYGAVKLVRTLGLSSRNRRGFRHLNRLIYFGLAWIAALRESADVVVAETDPPLLGILGAACKFFQNCRFIYYCQDVYPEVAQATGGLKNRALLWMLRLGNQLAYRHADAIVALSEDMAELLQRKAIPRDKITVLPNWIDCDLVRPQRPGPAWLQKYSGKFVVMYAGNLGWTQNLESVLEAAYLLDGDPRIKFVLVGDGARKKHLQEDAQRRRLRNLDFVDRVNPTDMSEVLAAADLHLIPLGAGVAGTMVPSKLYGILAAGKPFVAVMENEAEVARVAREFKVGFVVPPRDADGLAKAVSHSLGSPELLTEMGRRARVLAEQKYNRRLVTYDFAQFLETTLELPATTPFDEEDNSVSQIEKIATIQAD